jgi:hypothetical protein
VPEVLLFVSPTPEMPTNQKLKNGQNMAMGYGNEM